MRALITGVTGQDGSYLAEHLVQEGHEVYGMVRGLDHPKLDWITSVAPGLRILSGDLLDSSSLRGVLLTSMPDMVFNLAAISSPSQAWQQPDLTANVTGIGAMRLFEAVRSFVPTAHVVHASSIANHGPYGAAKLFAHTMAQDYRARGLHVSCTIFGGHHSPRRGPSFFSRKVTQAAARIYQGKQNSLKLGSLHRKQDWGWATDFVAQLPTVAQLPPDDYVMSTGTPYSVVQWVETAFAVVGLDWTEHVETDQSIGNVTDVPSLSADPDPRLSWTPNQDFEGLIRWMVDADLNGEEL